MIGPPSRQFGSLTTDNMSAYSGSYKTDLFATYTVYLLPELTDTIPTYVTPLDCPETRVEAAVFDEGDPFGCLRVALAAGESGGGSEEEGDEGEAEEVVKGCGVHGGDWCVDELCRWAGDECGVACASLD